MHRDGELLFRQPTEKILDQSGLTLYNAGRGWEGGFGFGRMSTGIVLNNGVDRYGTPDNGDFMSQAGFDGSQMGSRQIVRGVGTKRGKREYREVSQFVNEEVITPLSDNELK